jgi:hypothetical protein
MHATSRLRGWPTGSASMCAASHTRVGGQRDGLALVGGNVLKGAALNTVQREALLERASSARASAA